MSSEQDAPAGCMILFGGVFIAVGLAVAFFLAAPHLMLGHEAETWPTTDGQLLDLRKMNHHDDDGVTYSLVGRYTYRWQGEPYEGDRIGIYTGSDNIGTWHTDTRDRIKAEAAERGVVTVYVNPDEPSTALLDRTIRWDLALFELMFTVMFSGAGLLIAGGGIRSALGGSGSLAHVGPVEVGNHSAMLVMFGVIFTAMPLGIAATILPRALADGEYVALFILLFPAIGLFMLLQGVLGLAARFKWGHVHMHLSRAAEVGGEVVGTAEIARRLPPGVEVKATWVEERRVVRTDSDGDRNTSYVTIHSAEQVAEVEQHGPPSRLRFAFPIPHSGHPTAPGNHGTRWLLHLQADAPGLDLERSFEIPVTEGMMPVRTVTDTPDAVLATASDTPPPARHVAVREEGLDLWLDFHAARQRGMAVLIGGIGISFALVGIGIEITAGGELTPSLLGVIFTLVGALMASAGLWWLGSSYHLHLSLKGLVITRRWMGLPVSTEEASLPSLDGLDMIQTASSSTNGQTTLYWDLKADRVDGDPIMLASMLPDTASATWVLELLEAHLAGLGHAVPMRSVDPEDPFRSAGQRGSDRSS